MMPFVSGENAGEKMNENFFWKMGIIFLKTTKM